MYTSIDYLFHGSILNILSNVFILTIPYMMRWIAMTRHLSFNNTDGCCIHVSKNIEGKLHVVCLDRSLEGQINNWVVLSDRIEYTQITNKTPFSHYSLFFLFLFLIRLKKSDIELQTWYTGMRKMITMVNIHFYTLRFIYFTLSS